jgi:hypothetical protein
MALIDTPELAVRLARAIASDIALYNEAKIVAGIQNDNLFESLQDELSEGRELYKSRIAPDLYTRTNYFDRALVDVMLRPKGHIKSRIW